ncbi:MAG: 3-dehydroquinate synthase [Thermodesulfobacteriota bacterium]
MKQVEVGLTGERAYTITIKQGLLAQVAEELKKLSLGHRYVIISDDRVASLFADDLLGSCQAAGLDIQLLTFPHGEEAKNLTTINDLCRQLAALGLDRQGVLIALGGGVTGDICGFVAAIYMRGIKFVQVPTTLLAQVDSSVGGKTGVDIPEGKNLVGAFYQPEAVFIDPQVLTELPVAELLNGLAEVLKYGVIYDSAFFDFLFARRQAILALEPGVIAEVIARCCTIKAEVVAADEREADLRRILNYGHTLGHAVEAASDFTIAHGMAVAMGMVAVNKISMALGLLTEEQGGRILEVIAAFGLPTTIPAELDRERMFGYLATDKKTVGGRPFFVLPTQIGKVTITDQVEEEVVRSALA